MYINRQAATLGEICRAEMIDLCLPAGFRVNFGDDFLNSLFYGTLKTFIDRVDTSGFCHTSYGEEGGVKCYGTTHYPRDASEAAWVLASVGCFDKASSIIDFTLRNIPTGQGYIPHVYNIDGSVKANTVQVDTPGIVAASLGKLAELSGPSEKINEHYELLVKFMNSTFDAHYRNEYKLLDAGNFNEQFGGGSEPICDIFTNAAMYAGFKALSKTAKILGITADVDYLESQAELIAAGIEETLYDAELDIYRPMKDCGTGELGDVNWHSVYCRRWYPGRETAFDNAFEKLVATTSLSWDDYSIVGGRAGLEYCILGKIFGMFCGYMGASGRMKMLGHHLDFAKQTIVKPSNLFPEWWYRRKNANQLKYWDIFWEKYEGVWESYADNPDGDYTVDSGNCEQCSVYLNHAISDLLGIQTDGCDVTIAPAMPAEYSPIEVQDIPVGPNATISYKLEYANSLPKISISGRINGGLTVKLPVETGKSCQCFIDSEKTEFKRINAKDVDFVEIKLSRLDGHCEIVYK